MSVIINNDKCIKCGKCVNDCVCGALSIGSNGIEASPYCINCQHCMAICPTGAISAANIAPENCKKAPQISSADYESLCKVMQHRHSIRQYSNEKISEDEIKEILKQLRYIPTGCNFHNLQIRVLGGEKLNELRRVCAETIVKKLDNGEISKPFSGVLGSMRDGLAAGNDLLFRGAPYLVIVAVHKKAPCPEDGIIALSNFELLANAKNFGTCWCGVGYWIFKFIAPELANFLELGDDYTVAHTMLFGKPNVEYARVAEPAEFDVRLI